MELKECCKTELMNLSHDMLMDLERAKILTQNLLEKENTPPEIYVPIYFIDMMIKRIDQNNDLLETILLKNPEPSRQSKD